VAARRDDVPVLDHPAGRGTGKPGADAIAQHPSRRLSRRSRPAVDQHDHATLPWAITRFERTVFVVQLDPVVPMRLVLARGETRRNGVGTAASGAPDVAVPVAERGASEWRRKRVAGEHLGASMYELPPGQATFPYHYELGNDELLVVVAGRPTLRTPKGERQLGPGDCVLFPRQIARVHGHDDAMPVLWMPEDLVAPLRTIELPAAPRQRAYRLSRRHGREPGRHAPTETRSISAGAGSGSPWASMDSRYAAIASRIIARASSRDSPWLVHPGSAGTLTL